MLDYSFSEHFSISTKAGIRNSYTKNTTSFTEVHKYDSVVFSQVDSMNITYTTYDSVSTTKDLVKTSLFIELPVYFNYQTKLNDSWNLRISTGISNFWQIKHTNSNEADLANEFDFKDSWLLLYRFSIGLEQNITESLSFRIEPCLSIPLNQRDFLLGNKTIELKLGAVYKF